MKALFPRAQDVSAILINTSGGLTGGDRIEIEAEVGAGSQMSLTTQAAERAYRADSGIAQMRSKVTVRAGGRLNWLPQELILYDGCALHRTLEVSLAADAQALIVEPVIFGRLAMGERLSSGVFRDRIHVTRAGAPIYRDAVNLSGDIASLLARGAVCGGAAALCSVVFASPNAEAQLEPLRAMLPPSGAASLLGPDLLVLRLVAADGFELRRALLPVLDRLTGDALPASWRL